jgi:hypothetical protein
VRHTSTCVLWALKERVWSNINSADLYLSPGACTVRCPLCSEGGDPLQPSQKFFPPRERVVPAVCSWRKGAAARLVPLLSCFRVLHVDALFIYVNTCVCLGGAMCLSQKHADVGGGFSGFELALSCTVRAACTQGCCLGSPLHCRRRPCPLSCVLGTEGAVSAWLSRVLAGNESVQGFPTRGCLVCPLCP